MALKGFQPGHKFAKGRGRGHKNKVTKEIKEIWVSFLSSKMTSEEMDTVWNSMKADTKMLVLLKASEFFIPKLKQTDADVTVTGEITITQLKTGLAALDDSGVSELIEYLDNLIKEDKNEKSSNIAR